MVLLDESESDDVLDEEDVSSFFLFLFLLPFLDLTTSLDACGFLVRSSEFDVAFLGLSTSSLGLDWSPLSARALDDVEFLSLETSCRELR